MQRAVPVSLPSSPVVAKSNKIKSTNATPVDSKIRSYLWQGKFDLGDSIPITIAEYSHSWFSQMTSTGPLYAKNEGSRQEYTLVAWILTKNNLYWIAEVNSR